MGFDINTHLKSLKTHTHTHTRKATMIGVWAKLRTKRELRAEKRAERKERRGKIKSANNEKTEDNLKESSDVPEKETPENIHEETQARNEKKIRKRHRFGKNEDAKLTEKRLVSKETKKRSFKDMMKRKASVENNEDVNIPTTSEVKTTDDMKEINENGIPKEEQSFQEQEKAGQLNKGGFGSIDVGCENKENPMKEEATIEKENLETEEISFTAETKERSENKPKEGEVSNDEKETFNDKKADVSKIEGNDGSKEESEKIPDATLTTNTQEENDNLEAFNERLNLNVSSKSKSTDNVAADQMVKQDVVENTSSKIDANNGEIVKEKDFSNGDLKSDEKKEETSPEDVKKINSEKHEKVEPTKSVNKEPTLEPAKCQSQVNEDKEKEPKEKSNETDSKEEVNSKVESGETPSPGTKSNESEVKSDKSNEVHAQETGVIDNNSNRQSTEKS